MKYNLIFRLTCFFVFLTNAFAENKKIEIPIRPKYTINKVERSVVEIVENSKQLLLKLNRGIKNLKAEEEDEFDADVYDELEKIKKFISIFDHSEPKKNLFNISYNEELNNFKVLEQSWSIQKHSFYNDRKLNVEFSQYLSIYKNDIRFFSKLISEEYKKQSN